MRFLGRSKGLWLWDDRKGIYTFEGGQLLVLFMLFSYSLTLVRADPAVVFELGSCLV
jgi:hypothetical protein